MEPTRPPLFTFLQPVPTRYSQEGHRRASPGQDSGLPVPGAGSWGNRCMFFPPSGISPTVWGHCRGRGGLWNLGPGGGPSNRLGGVLQTHPLGGGRCHLPSRLSRWGYPGPRSLPIAPAALRLFPRSHAQPSRLWYLEREDIDLSATIRTKYLFGNKIHVQHRIRTKFT